MNKAFPRFPLVPIILFLCAWLGGVAPAFALPVQAVAVQSTPWSREARVLGTVESIGEVTLTSPVTGRVLGPFLQSGNVAAGAVVAHIAPPGLHAGILAAQARVAYARTQLERTQKLFQDGVMAQQNVDQAGLALAEARSALRALEAQSGDQVLTAPFAGTLHYLVPPRRGGQCGQPYRPSGRTRRALGTGLCDARPDPRVTGGDNGGDPGPRLARSGAGPLRRTECPPPRSGLRLCHPPPGQSPPARGMAATPAAVGGRYRLPGAQPGGGHARGPQRGFRGPPGAGGGGGGRGGAYPG